MFWFNQFTNWLWKFHLCILKVHFFSILQTNFYLKHRHINFIFKVSFYTLTKRGVKHCFYNVSSIVFQQWLRFREFVWHKNGKQTLKLIAFSVALVCLNDTWLCFFLLLYYVEKTTVMFLCRFYCTDPRSFSFLCIFDSLSWRPWTRIVMSHIIWGVLQRRRQYNYECIKSSNKSQTPR